MTSEESDRENRYPIGCGVASLIIDHLQDNPEMCLEVRGRIGGMPIVRYGNKEWQYVTKVGLGGIMAGTFTEREIRLLIMEGPRVTLREADELACWEYWPDGREI